LKLLIIDADQAYSAWLAERLASRGFVPRTCTSLDQAIRERLFEPTGAVIAATGSAQAEGAVVAMQMRRAGVDQPLMVLSSNDDWHDAIECLDAGADDYLVKPVRSEVVAARLRAIIRRVAGTSTDRIERGDLELDLKARCAWLAGECLNLTRNEFRLLRLFFFQPNHVMTQREIHLQLSADGTSFSQNAVEVQIARLRRKVGHCRIRTVRGVGYTYCTEAPLDAGTAGSHEPSAGTCRNSRQAKCNLEACSNKAGHRGSSELESDFQPEIARAG